MMPPSCIKRCHCPNPKKFPCNRSLRRWCASPGPPIKWSSTSTSTPSTTDSRTRARQFRPLLQTCCTNMAHTRSFHNLPATIRSQFSISSQKSHSRGLAVQSNQRPSWHVWHPSGGGSAHNGSRHALGSPCMKAFSRSAKVPSDWVEARIRIMILVDATSGVGAAALDLVEVRTFDSMHAPSCFCKVSAVRFLPAQDQPGRNHSWLLLMANCVAPTWPRHEGEQPTFEQKHTVQKNFVRACADMIKRQGLGLTIVSNAN